MRFARSRLDVQCSLVDRIPQRERLLGVEVYLDFWYLWNLVDDMMVDF